MLFSPSDLEEVLLPPAVGGVDTTHETALWLSLPLVVLLSSAGMLIIKCSEQIDSSVLLGIGLSLEGCAFLIYPFSMRKYHLRTITASWAGGSLFTAIAGGATFFGESPSIVSLAGCSLVLCGILVNAFG
jgi:multidrug transporter EmrE-like cation transporter